MERVVLGVVVALKKSSGNILFLKTCPVKSVSSAEHIVDSFHRDDLLGKKVVPVKVLDREEGCGNKKKKISFSCEHHKPNSIYGGREI